MPDKFAECNARLEQLVHEIMKETNPVRYDQLAEEIWRVLEQREEENNADKNEQPRAA